MRAEWYRVDLYEKTHELYPEMIHSNGTKKMSETPDKMICKNVEDGRRRKVDRE